MNERSRMPDIEAMKAADRQKRADLAWVKAAPGRRLVGGRRMEAGAPKEQNQEIVRPETQRAQERKAVPEKSDRAAVERAAEDRARERKIESARSTMEQIATQIASVAAKARGAEATGDEHAKAQWAAVKRSLEQEMAKQRANMEQFKKAA